MKTKLNSTTQITLNYGFILGIMFIVSTMIAYFSKGELELDPIRNLFVYYLIFACIIVLGLRAFKIAKGGFITLGEALKIGVAIALIGIIISIIFNFIFKYLTDSSDINISEKTIAMKEMTKEAQTMGLIISFIINLIISFIISLVAGLIMKKSPEQDY